MAIERADVVEYIKNLSVMDLSELIKELEDVLGVSAAAPAMMAAMPGAGAAPAEEAEEQTEFDLELQAIGEKKIQVIKALREIDKNLGLKEAKTLAEAAPTKVLEAVTKEEAEAAKTKLMDAGATAEVK
jgi:large subunit ribosomal protein L7/L12